jgi:hypothetical protein
MAAGPWARWDAAAFDALLMFTPKYGSMVGEAAGMAAFLYFDGRF